MEYVIDNRRVSDNQDHREKSHEAGAPLSQILWSEKLKKQEK